MLVKSKVKVDGFPIWFEIGGGHAQDYTLMNSMIRCAEEKIMSLSPTKEKNTWNPMSDDIEPGDVVGEIEIRCLGFNDIEEIVLHTVSGKGIDWNSEAVEGIPVISSHSKGCARIDREIYHRCIISLDEDGCLCHDKDNTVRQLNAVGWRRKKKGV